jgi:protoporphyrinogen IX oxidase
MTLPGEAYVWIKALHVIAVIAWMAGIFYLPRLFVYHSAAEPDTEVAATFKVMERRLYRAIMMPAMVVAWIAGLTMAIAGQLWAEAWFLAKLVLVIAMTGFHFWLGARQRDFAAGRNRLSSRDYRIANELPTVLVIAIVILVIVKPF